MDETTQVKARLGSHLKGGEAFITIDELLKELPFDKLGIRPNNLPYSLFELFYHIRFTQKDILEYCLNDNYREHNWPEDYWPRDTAPQNEEAWENLKQGYFRERELFIEHLLKPETNLLAPVRTNPDHSLLREVLLVIEHTAYHTGQMLVLSRQLGIHQ
ncbi:MAG TPA: DinB family protein [Gillisia sp.]|nr:DinB family protein [Gillisia sp.]